MRTRLQTRFALPALLALLVSVPAFSADEPAADEPEESTKKLNALIESSVDWYELFPDVDAETALRPEPVLRWRNAARRQAGEAMMVVWAHNGRPEAIASIFPWEGFLYHEFGSVSRAATLVARDNGNVVWSPRTPGVEFKPVTDATPPADSPPARLRQMKAIAERFKATMTGWKGDDSDREELRLLPRPIYRYNVKPEQNSQPPLVDGALFAFVMGTDPETVMLLEAVGTPGEATWQYAFVRATSGGLEVRLGDEVVWKGEKFPPALGPVGSSISLGRPLPD